MGATIGKRKIWLPFEEARSLVRFQHLKSEKEWREFRKNDLPQGVPTNPHKVYPDRWRGMGDWLGTGRVADRDRQYRTLEEAKKWARNSGIKSISQWREAVRNAEIPENIPRAPYASKHYRNEWKGWGDFLGTERVKWSERGNPNSRHAWRKYDEAQQWALDNGILTSVEWELARQENRIPADIPKIPHRVYDEWNGWPQFFGRIVRGGSSIIEHIIRHELSRFIEVDNSIRSIDIGRPKRIDIAIKCPRVIIEYDGAHWHKNTVRKDRTESKEIEKLGWQVIRIREKPLKLISKYDIQVSAKSTIFRRVCKILDHLIDLDVIPKSQRSAAIKNKERYRFRVISSLGNWGGGAFPRRVNGRVGVV